MVEGDKWEMYIPSELGVSSDWFCSPTIYYKYSLDIISIVQYGDNGSGAKIPGGSVLVFTMEIIKINGDKVPALTCDAWQPTEEDCTDRERNYIRKMMDAGDEAITIALNRLESMADKKMSDELRGWFNARVHLLRQLQTGEKEEL